MRVLILGGTLFLGRHLVEAALERGHEVTLFNRGRTNPELFPEVEKLRGDRDNGDLAALETRTWDAVIDTSGYVPRVVRQSAELLRDAVDVYVFVSSLSVYMPTPKLGVSEDEPVNELDDQTSEDVDANYGPLKALCERAVETTLPGRALNLRSGLLIGPHDPTNRFAYWVSRVARGGDVLAPGPPDARVQLIDVRDFSEWAILMAEERQGGTFNVTGPVRSFAQMLDACGEVTGSDARIVWVEEAFLLENSVDLPLWAPLETEPEWAGFFAVDTSLAERHGLATRPLEESCRAVLDAEDAEPAKFGPRIPRDGLEPDREAELLEAWTARR
jgi:2'-hydroxyisoflavone reductase